MLKYNILKHVFKAVIAGNGKKRVAILAINTLFILYGRTPEIHPKYKNSRMYYSLVASYQVHSWSSMQMRRSLECSQEEPDN